MGREATSYAAGSADNELADLPLTAFRNDKEDEENDWSVISFLYRML